MFNIGPLELMVLAIVGLVVLGPDKLPGLARDAARMIRTLRDLATGARQQLRDELGPEFADVDLRNLNPRHAISKVLLGDEFSDTFSNTDFRKYDPRRFDAKSAARDFMDGDREDRVDNGHAPTRDEPVDFAKGDARPRTNVHAAANGAGSVSGSDAGVNGTNGSRPRPRPRPAGASDENPNDTPYDSDAT